MKIPGGIARRRDMGVVGVVIMLSQVLSGLQSSQSVTTEIQKFKEEFQQSQIDREKYFVRKSDVASISDKIDSMNDKLIRITEQMKLMRDHYSAASLPIEPVIGCSVKGDSIHEFYDL